MLAKPAITWGVLKARQRVGKKTSGLKLRRPTLFIPYFNRSSPVTEREIAISSRTKGVTILVDAYCFSRGHSISRIIHLFRCLFELRAKVRVGHADEGICPLPLRK